MLNIMQNERYKVDKLGRECIDFRCLFEINFQNTLKKSLLNLIWWNKEKCLNLYEKIFSCLSWKFFFKKKLNDIFILFIFLFVLVHPTMSNKMGTRAIRSWRIIDVLCFGINNGIFCITVTLTKKTKKIMWPHKVKASIVRMNSWGWMISLGMHRYA